MSKVLKSTTLGASVDCIPLVSSVNLRNTHLAAFSALLYIVVFGMVSAYSAPATVDMKKPGSRFRYITADQITWIASIHLISGIIGNCLSGYISHKLGRKASLMYVSASYTSSWLMIAYAPAIPVIYLGRLISGFCAGVCSVAVPAYVVEISTVEIRGLLTAGFQVGFSLGVFIVMSLGIVLRWSWLAVSGAIIVVAGAFLMLIMPESPTWLLRERKSAEAIRGIKFLKGQNVDTDKEVREITDSLAEQPKGGNKLKELLDPAFYKPVTIAILLMFFQQFSGINSIMAYIVEIFQKSNTSLDPHVASAIVAGVQVVSTAISSMLMDRAGRRLLYITSGTFMALSLTLLGLYSFIGRKYEMDLTFYGWVPIVCFIVYMSAFSLGFGPIPFVMTPEMVPIRSRSLLLAIANVSSSVFAFIVTKTFDNMRTSIGDYGVYWTYGSVSFLGILFCWFFLPETKGRTIHEIHRSFSNPWGSM